MHPGVEKAMPMQSTSPELPNHSTQGQQAEESLKQSEERFRTLVANIPGVVYRCACDSEWTMAFLSEAIQELSGYPPSDFINNRVRSFASIIYPQDRARVEQTIWQSMRAKQPYVIEYRIVRADGSLAWVYDKGQGIFGENDGGEPQELPLQIDGVILDITERKQAEVELRCTQAFLNSVVENLPVGVFIKDAVELRVMYWNKASEELFGYSREQVLGKNDYDYLPKEQAQDLQTKDRQLLVSGKMVDISEVPLITPHRGERLLHTKKVPLLDENGTPRYLLAICEDITDRKRAEDAMRESEAHYRRIVETASEGVWMFDVDSQTTFANSRMAQMLGYTVEEMLGRSLFDFIDEESRTLATAYVERRRQGIQERHDFKFRRKDGSDLWAIVSAAPILDAAGQFVGVLRMITDISDRKQAEKALRDSEQRFRATFDQAAVGIAHVELNGKFLRINQKFCDLLGYTQEEMLVRTFQDITHPNELEADLTYRRQVLSGEIQMFSLEKRYITRRGDILWVNVTISVRRSSSGKPKYFISVVQDISDRKQAEEALRQSESQLRVKNQQLQQTLCQLKQTQAQLIQNEKMISLGQMVAGIAHEINNPISFIYGNVTPAREYASALLHLLQLYALHYPEPVAEIQTQREALDLNFIMTDFPKVLHSMKEGANRIREIVLSLRNFSRLDEAEMKEVNIHEGIDNTLLILQHRLKEQSSHPEIQVSKEYGSLPLVECYPGKLNQVFMNLLSNAIDALQTHPCPRLITIRTEVKDEGGLIHPNHVVIRIADNGPGIPDDVKKHIFDPFFTTKPVGVGTGLGLSISHSIVVEKHHGNLICISAPGQGAEFVIELPVQQKPLRKDSLIGKLGGPR